MILHKHTQMPLRANHVELGEADEIVSHCVPPFRLRSFFTKHGDFAKLDLARRSGAKEVGCGKFAARGSAGGEVYAD